MKKKLPMIRLVLKPRTEYVCGFLFCSESVALINKNRPANQKGKLNGVGGHIEKGETPLDAMVREFEEETSRKILNWRRFFVLTGKDFVVHFYCTRIELGSNITLRSLTDEIVNWYPVSSVLFNHRLMENLKWLIPMALDENNIIAKGIETENFDVVLDNKMEKILRRKRK